MRRQVDYILIDEICGCNLLDSSCIGAAKGKTDHMAVFASFGLHDRPFRKPQKFKVHGGWAL